MPTPIANRYGKFNAPSVQAGRAPSTAEAEANIGKIGENTMKLMEQSGNQLARAVTYMNRQKEQMAAQDALTEYLAGRQKLDAVRDSLALENAVDFEDKYYQEAEKMHTEFVNKINRLQYADIRERVRGQANDTNIMDAARAENYFWKQKEAVADNHTNALIKTKIQDVVNNVNSNPGMEDYNKGNIAEGYNFILDTKKNRLIEQGFRDGTPEMTAAMSKTKDEYFAAVLEELSHRPDDGLHIAHEMGKAFKQEMTPEAYNKIMAPISQANLSEEIIKNPAKFFKNGDVAYGKIDFDAAADESDALNNYERRRFLESVQAEAQKGKEAAAATKDTLFSITYMRDQALKMKSKLGTWGGLINENGEIKEISADQKAKISKHLQQNANVSELVNMMFEWEQQLPRLTEADQRKLVTLQTSLVNILGSDPDLAMRPLTATWFAGKKPTAQEVIYASIIANHIKNQRKETWRDAIPFGAFGQSPMDDANLTGLLAALRAGYKVAHNGNVYMDKNGAMLGEARSEFDNLDVNVRNNIWAALASQINEDVGAEYGMKNGSVSPTAFSTAMYGYQNDFKRRTNSTRKSFMPFEIATAGDVSYVRSTYLPENIIRPQDLSTLYYMGSSIGRSASRVGSAALQELGKSDQAKGQLAKDIVDNANEIYNNITSNANIPLAVKSTGKIGAFKQTYMSANEPQNPVINSVEPSRLYAYSTNQEDINYRDINAANPVMENAERTSVLKDNTPVIKSSETEEERQLVKYYADLLKPKINWKR